MRLPRQLLHRKLNAHKGDFGHIFILAGSARFSGAAVLCSSAAMRTGAGLVTLGVPKSLNSAIIKIKTKEVMTLPLPQTREGALSFSGFKEIKKFIKKADVLVIGPGLSLNSSTQKLVRKVTSSTDKPVVIDADGLNALSGHLSLFRDSKFEIRNKILTPHPAEFSRISGLSIKKIQSDRIGIASKFAGEHKVTVVLKGHNTVVADYRRNTYINHTGNPGMSSAGSGDVLTGMIAAFLGQGLNTFKAAKYAVYLHGLAGDLAAKKRTQISLIASDIIDKIPEAIKLSS